MFEYVMSAKLKKYHSEELSENNEVITKDKLRIQNWFVLNNSLGIFL